jgi:AcrR family transcriptional regulator
MNKLKMQKEVQTQIKDTELVQKKRLQIAMGASKLFINKGYSQTSIREITKATGLTVGNLYDYVTRKEDILYLVFDVFQSMWVSALKEDGVFEIEDPVKQLESAIKRMLKLVNENRDMVLLMYTESKSLPKKFLKIILEKESELVECFEKILESGIKKGVFKIKSPFLLANIIVYLLSIEALRGWNLKRQYEGEKAKNLIGEYILETVLKSVQK